MEGHTTEIPWPPVQVFRWKTMLAPLLIARQSSWFMIVLSWMTRLFVLQSNPSVLWPAAFEPLALFGLSPSAAHRSSQLRL